MRVRKMTALMLAGAMTASMGTFAFADEAKELPTIDSIKLGEDYTDLTASIKVLTHRTDIVDTTFQDYIKKFNESYPNITIEYEAVTDYAEDIKLRLTTDDWGDICGIPTNLQKNELEDEFISYGDKKTLDENYVLLNNFAYNGNVYGIPSTGNAQGIVYNKKVFEEAGVTELPKTPTEFIEALQKDAVSIVLMHNHPSGDPTPSREDMLTTKRILDAGALIGIELLDHIIIGNNCYISFREEGIL